MSRVVIVHGHRDSPDDWKISNECLLRVEHASSIVENDDILILSGAGHKDFLSEAEQMYEYLPPRTPGVFLEEKSNTTLENKKNSLEIASFYIPSQIVVVSSWWHLRIPVIWLDSPVRFRFERSQGDIKYLPKEIESWKKYLTGMKSDIGMKSANRIQ